MKSKNKLLLLIAAFSLVALCAIQYYLVASTYDLKVAQFQIEIKEKILSSTSNYNDLDTTLLEKKEMLYQTIAQNYLLDKNYKWQLKKQLFENSFKEEITKNIASKFEKDFPNDSLKFAVITSKFIIVTKNKRDTIFSEKPTIQSKLYGNLKDIGGAFLVRNYLNTTAVKTTKGSFKIITEDNLYVSIANWQSIVLKRMASILAFALLSIVVVIAIFIYILKMAIRQKKINDIKSDFINNISHELKTPITTLSVSTNILNRKEVFKNPELHAQVLNTIKRQTDRLEALVDQVVTNSVANTNLVLKKEKININHFLKTIVSDFQIANPTISVTCQTHENSSCTLDVFHITTAISNVLENAVKYGATILKIECAVSQQELFISVSDNGIGIAKNKQRMLFQKFYRVESGKIHNVKGLGLGLFYVNQIIKAHQGTVNLVSDLGKGSTFVLRLPSYN